MLQDNPYSKILPMILLSTLFSLGCLAFLTYRNVHVESPPYYAIMPGNVNQPLTTLAMPNLSKKALLQWSVQAATLAYTYNFGNYETVLANVSNYFTNEGWADYQTALDAAGTIAYINEKKLALAAVPTDAAVIIQEGVIEGRYAWKIQVPMLVTYTSASESVPQNILITMLVSRIPTWYNPKGIGIVQFIAE